MKLTRNEMIGAKHRLTGAALRTLLGMLMVAAPTFAQGNAAKGGPANPFIGNQAAIDEGKGIYDKACTVCHGRDGAAGDQAPAIAAPARRYLRITDAELYDAIMKGISGTLMPAGGLTETDAWKVTAYLKALRGTAIDAPVKGDVAHGEQIFAGKGGCLACHMMKGKGGLMGPDLSNIASQRKLISIQDALTKPLHKVATDGGHHDSGLMPSSSYKPVRLVTRDGKTISGVLRNEDSFSIQILGSDNQIHMYQRDQLRDVVYEQKSLMPTDYDKRLTAVEMQDLLAFLTRQGKVAPARPARAGGGQQDDN